MARARSLKPGFFKNEDLAECSFAARLCFAGLWTLADREGRLEDRPKRIKAELFAFDTVEVEPLLQELVSRGGFIRRYRVGDVALIQILNFGKHQNPHHREAPSVLPAPDGWVQQVAEPEAAGSSHDVKAPGQPEASPGLLPHEVTLQGVKTVLTPDSLFSDSGHSDSLPSDDPPASGASVAASTSKPTKRKTTVAKEPAPTTATWEAYSEAYASRYHAAPLRNPKVNGQLVQLLKRLPVDEAPMVAKFYVEHADRFYCQTGHGMDMLLKHAEKLRMEWFTGTKVQSETGRPRGRQNFAGMDYSGGPDFAPADRKTRQLQTAALMTCGSQRTTEAFDVESRTLEN